MSRVRVVQRRDGRLLRQLRCLPGLVRLSPHAEPGGLGNRRPRPPRGGPATPRGRTTDPARLVAGRCRQGRVGPDCPLPSGVARAWHDRVVAGCPRQGRCGVFAVRPRQGRVGFGCSLHNRLVAVHPRLDRLGRPHHDRVGSVRTRHDRVVADCPRHDRLGPGRSRQGRVGPDCPLPSGVARTRHDRLVAVRARQGRVFAVRGR
ncbi:hypothetical protein [Streptomyces sp. NPDC059566]|uniref:hypothetical protein n=1 Tax=Streptomyces sp. NPDC059566 TaxID=3346866 RepID=UPI0036C1D522